MPIRPPGPKGWPILGNLLEYRRDPLAFLKRCRRDYGDVVRARLGSGQSYLLFHPRDIERLLRTNHSNFIKDKDTRGYEILLGEGLVTSEGNTWRRQHELLRPSFQRDQVQRYTSVIVRLAERTLISWRDGQILNIHKEMMHLTLPIIGQILLSSDATELATLVEAGAGVIMKYFSLPGKWINGLSFLPTPTNLRFWRIQRRIDSILYSLIQQRRKDDEHVDDLLSQFVKTRDEEGTRLSCKELRDQLLTLLISGYETSALALTYALYLLTQYPEAQEKLAAEVHYVLGNNPVTGPDVARLQYTELVVREALRLYPPAYCLGRETLNDMTLGDYLIPKGSQVSANQFLVQRDQRWFKEPDQFVPERWNGELMKELPRCAYFPFGDGPRKCIGEKFAMTEIVTILAMICRRFRLRLVNPEQPLQFLFSITLRPRHPIWMEVMQR